MKWKIPAILVLAATCTMVGLQDRALAVTKTIEIKVPQCA